MRKFDEYRASAIADPRFYEPLDRADLGDEGLPLVRFGAAEQLARLLPRQLEPTFPPDGKITSDSKAIAASRRFRHHRFR